MLVKNNVTGITMGIKKYPDRIKPNLVIIVKNTEYRLASFATEESVEMFWELFKEFLGYDPENITVAEKPSNTMRTLSEDDTKRMMVQLRRNSKSIKDIAEATGEEEGKVRAYLKSMSLAD